MVYLGGALVARRQPAVLTQATGTYSGETDQRRSCSAFPGAALSRKGGSCSSPRPSPQSDALAGSGGGRG